MVLQGQEKNVENGSSGLLDCEHRIEAIISGFHPDDAGSIPAARSALYIVNLAQEVKIKSSVGGYVET
jgi:hypothetical protein